MDAPVKINNRRSCNNDLSVHTCDAHKGCPHGFLYICFVSSIKSRTLAWFL